ncbi:hypothetical protein G3480_25235 [Thiorhodococcus mannitoliphagus]|uniref:Uncharacterized protein n=1 Tax=Thiorhodococcus mannitoliphagus TaxID=329406 RepID=A0A6P1E2X2_9GAMM|nr:hypothetical protein [Thiorhodococcus mannitoliphagus]
MFALICDNGFEATCRLTPFASTPIACVQPELAALVPEHSHLLRDYAFEHP